MPNGHPFTQKYSFLPIFTIYSFIAPERFTPFSPPLQSVSPTNSHPANVVFLAGIIVVMAPKSKQAEREENPFLSPPVDLDRIPLVDKDQLIIDTKCDFDFTDLQSWLKEVFLDQSDEIGLWESNLLLYLFPQIHPFPEFSLKCQAHYIPEQRVIVSSFGEILFLVTPESIDQMMQIPQADPVSPFNLEILTELYQKMTFPQRAQIFELFLPPSAQFPSTNPLYPSSMFSTKGN
jgi:hypothetical protein